MAALVERVVPRRFSVPYKVDCFAFHGQALTNVRTKERTGIGRFLPGLVPAHEKVNDALDQQSHLVNDRREIKEQHAAQQYHDRSHELFSSRPLGQ
jgi:hypothetical protein